MGPPDFLAGGKAFPGKKTKTPPVACFFWPRFLALFQMPLPTPISGYAHGYGILLLLFYAVT